MNIRLLACTVVSAHPSSHSETDAQANQDQCSEFADTCERDDSREKAEHTSDFVNRNEYDTLQSQSLSDDLM